MKAVVQRVSRASVTVNGELVGNIERGLLVLVAAHRDDTFEHARKMADRVNGLRIFSDTDGKMNLALADLPPEPNFGVLAVSNFTVYGETAKNRRPSFIESAAYAKGEEMFNEFLRALQNRGYKVASGVFGADMQVELLNDGPVTVILEVGP